MRCETHRIEILTGASFYQVNNHLMMTPAPSKEVTMEIPLPSTFFTGNPAPESRDERGEIARAIVGRITY
jgi:hypothetical protein